MTTSRSSLQDAARQLEEEIEHYLRLAGSLLEQPLRSGKDLERAAHALGELADCDGRLHERVSALSAALQALRDEQLRKAEAVRDHARSLEARASDYGELLRSFAQLGEQAAALNERARGALDAGEAGQDRVAFDTSLGTLADDMGALADSARATQKQAEEKDFGDVARSAESLRQQLLSARNRLGLARGGPLSN